MPASLRRRLRAGHRLPDGPHGPVDFRAVGERKNKRTLHDRRLPAPTKRPRAVGRPGYARHGAQTLRPARAAPGGHGLPGPSAVSTPYGGSEPPLRLAPTPPPPSVDRVSPSA